MITPAQLSYSSDSHTVATGCRGALLTMMMMLTGCACKAAGSISFGAALKAKIEAEKRDKVIRDELVELSIEVPGQRCDSSAIKLDTVFMPAQRASLLTRVTRTGAGAAAR
jgi:hypothetical protein